VTVSAFEQILLTHGRRESMHDNSLTARLVNRQLVTGITVAGAPVEDAYRFHVTTERHWAGSQRS
jgi:hypothetical protein